MTARSSRTWIQRQHPQPHVYLHATSIGTPTRILLVSSCKYHCLMPCPIALLTANLVADSMLSKGFSLLLWVFLVHLAGIYLYTRGFLLTRLALPDISTCTPESCPFPPSYNKAVILIIDSLRFDFISPNPPQPPSLYHHHVLSLPAELTRMQPEHSLLLNSFPDPPTTTLQRIKALTTGSLPTFVDMGSNFGGSSILEDTIIGQLLARGKNVSTNNSWLSVAGSKT